MAWNGAAFFVAVAAALQLLTWWLLWDDITFGPRGTGTQVIADLFGAKAFPLAVALKLEYAVRGAILLGLVLVVFGMPSTHPANRYRNPAPVENPFA